MATLKYKIGDKVILTNGNIMTIDQIDDISKWYRMREDPWNYYTDEMIESLVERNGKTYPYKIGDRVVLKGNNRCATITDLKYNSWGNLSYYVKIDNDKDVSIDYPIDLLLPYDNKVKGFLEEETIPIPKFKVENKASISKLQNSSMLSALERGFVDNIISALEFLEKDKMIGYVNEIEFLKKIRTW